jgi:hypothetical protein
MLPRVGSARPEVRSSNKETQVVTRAMVSGTEPVGI